MIAQLRVYTINRGMMDSWVKQFNEVLVPMQRGFGIGIESAWVNEAKTEFIWIRSYADAEDMKAKEAAFYGSDEWKAVVDYTRSHLAKTQVTPVVPAGMPEA